MLLPMPKVVLLGVDAILPNIPKDKLLLKLLIEAGGVCWRGMQPCHFAEAIAVQRLQLHTPHRGCTRRKSFGPHSQPQRAFAVPFRSSFTWTKTPNMRKTLDVAKPSCFNQRAHSARTGRAAAGVSGWPVARQRGAGLATCLALRPFLAFPCLALKLPPPREARSRVRRSCRRIRCHGHLSRTPSFIPSQRVIFYIR